MTKINYEDDGKTASVKVEGMACDLFKALCRIAVKLKADIKTTGDKTFEELLLDGIKVAELEKVANDLSIEELDDIDKLLDALIEKLGKLAND